LYIFYVAHILHQKQTLPMVSLESSYIGNHFILAQ
jgi:hypothetical protein